MDGRRIYIWAFRVFRRIHELLELRPSSAVRSRVISWFWNQVSLLSGFRSSSRIDGKGTTKINHVSFPWLLIFPLSFTALAYRGWFSFLIDDGLGEHSELRVWSIAALSWIGNQKPRAICLLPLFSTTSVQRGSKELFAECALFNSISGQYLGTGLAVIWSQKDRQHVLTILVVDNGKWHEAQTNKIRSRPLNTQETLFSHHFVDSVNLWYVWSSWQIPKLSGPKITP